MMERKNVSRLELTKDVWPDDKEELKMVQQLHLGIRYHVETQYLLLSRRSKQRTIIIIAFVAAVLTTVFAIL